MLDLDRASYSWRTTIRSDIENVRPEVLVGFEVT